jgi:riboflavin biosynthesis pyrimidine reductase
MRQLLPEAVDDVDVAQAYRDDARRAPAGRPWVLVNMIASIDGATTVGGVSGPLGGPADRVVFAAIRSVPDVIVAGARTVRAEGYGPARAQGDRPPPRIAVVTGSGDLDPGLRLFTEADPDLPPPLVLTCEACPPERRAALAEVAEVVVAGTAIVDLAAALGELARRGVAIVLSEGGPTLNGQLVAGGLVDEWCASVAPALVAGASSRPAAGGPPTDGALAMRLERLLAADDLLFARYVRADAEEGVSPPSRAR